MSEEELITMYRPCGQKELDLVAESGFKRWPPRLPEQPIFYPVTNEAYAIEVNKWNVSQFGKGYVTRFRVRRGFVEKYRIEQVGGRHHTEWWIPAEDLENFNDNIVGEIEVIYEESAA
ncbi:MULTISPECIES: hypothetical protein [Marinobacter]|uniref:hypothetical protein n=1 Tax=Marinobacter TaxID=2742 RepID=UPI001C577DCF|nr:MULTISPECIES: hypothetical protein [Marinobacter]MBW3199505.1 hypothetical protein [Marinobacter nauticus]MBY6184921.1 hypothetical protein [Marinobacter nauticus]